MPRIDYTTCRECGAHTSEVGTLSHERLCERCGPARLTSNVHQMIDHRGPNFDLWRRKMAASVGAVLLDDVTADA